MKITQWYRIDRGTGAEEKVSAAMVISKVMRHYATSLNDARRSVGMAADNGSGVETSFFWYEPRTEEVAEHQEVALG